MSPKYMLTASPITGGNYMEQIRLSDVNATNQISF